MNHQSAVHAYREDSVENAPPVKIVRMMYEGAIKRLERARRMDPASDAPAFNECLDRADRIVCELRFSLDAESAPELSKQLEGLYLFVEDGIAKAFGERVVEPLGPAVDVLRTLLDAWCQLDVAERAA